MISYTMIFWNPLPPPPPHHLGVGKSTVAACLSMALANLNTKVHTVNCLHIL